MHGTAVEVRKNPKSTTWYNATLKDLKGDSVVVSFEDEIWPSRDVPSSSVRMCPKVQSDDSFAPGPDEAVEVLTASSESSPSGWAEGRVRTIKNDFYFISFSGHGQDMIVEKSALRRVSNEMPLDVSNLARRIVEVVPELQAWIRTQDSQGCLAHVRAKGRLLVASVSEPKTNGAPYGVRLIGGERELDLGEKLLVQIHFKHQIKMQWFHDMREKFLERLEGQKEWWSTQHVEVFQVEQSATGKIIGKKGENIKALRQKYDVDVELEEGWDEEKNRAAMTVTISGKSEESVTAAREEIEFVTVKIPVAPDQVGWILGKGYQNISEIAKKTELHYARFDDKAKCIELCGRRQEVEVAKLLISVHSEYLPVYQDMDEEQHAIQQSFDQLFANKGKGKELRKGEKGGKERNPGGDRSENKEGKGGKGKDSGKDAKEAWKDEWKDGWKDWKDEGWKDDWKDGWKGHENSGKIGGRQGAKQEEKSETSAKGAGKRGGKPKG